MAKRSNRSASQSAPKNFRTGKTSEEVSATNSSIARMRQSEIGETRFKKQRYQ